MSRELQENTPTMGSQAVEGSFSRRHGKKIASFIALLIIGAGLVMLWYFLQLPAKGNVRTIKQKQPESFDENQEKKLYRGKFIEFSHRALYTEKTHEIAEKGPVRERIWLIGDDVEGRKIAIVVTQREGNDFTSEPSYVMRQNDQASYQSTPLPDVGFEGVVYTNHVAPFETVAFFRKDGYIISVSLSSLFKSEGLKEELFQILKSLSFSLR